MDRRGGKARLVPLRVDPRNLISSLPGRGADKERSSRAVEVEPSAGRGLRPGQATTRGALHRREGICGASIHFGGGSRVVVTARWFVTLL